MASNASARSILGLTADQLHGHVPSDPSWQTIDADGHMLAPDRFPRAVAQQTGAPQRDVLVGLHHPDGNIRWLSVTAAPFGDGPDGVVVRFADVTAQQATVRDLRDQARRMEDVEAIARLGTWKLEMPSQRFTLSDGMYRLLGKTRETLPPDRRSFEELVVTKDRERAFAALEASLRAGEDTNTVHRIRRADGSIGTFRIRGRPRFNEHGELVGIMGTTQDISEPARMERELAQARDQLRGVLDAVTEHAIIATNPWGVITDVNRGAELMFGYTTQEMVGRTPDIWHDPGDVIARARELGIPPSLDVFTMNARLHAPETREWTFIRKGGERRRMVMTLTVQRDAAGTVAGYISVARDITDAHRAESARRRAEARFRTAFDHAPIGVALVDLATDHSRIVDANRALALLVGRDEDELDGTSLTALVHPEDGTGLQARLCDVANGRLPSFQTEVRLMHRDGQFVWALLGGAGDVEHDGTDDEEPTAVLQILDITERKRFEGQLQYLADHDPLTGMFNRRRFEEEFERALAHAERYRVPGALMVVDLDGLKAVNDTLGHAVGDELIERVARLLRHSLRTSDIVARLGGDEFGVLLPQMSRDGAQQVAEKLLDELRDGGVVLTANRHGRVTASIGVTTWDGPPANAPHELLIQADLAMYAAKAGGRDRFAMHDPAEHAGSEPLGAAWLDRLRDALDTEDGFVLHAQPIVPLTASEDSVERFELLVRMRDDDGSLIPPGTFLTLAERYDLVQQLDRWVLGRALDLIRRREEAGRPVNVTVNLSGRTMNDPTLARDVELLLRDGPIREGALTVEVTETEAIVNIDRARVLARDLRALGCRFALDDFGAGFASFYYLKHLAFDLLKIDGEFIRQLPITPTDRLVVRAVVDIAKAMGTQTCAEFVGDDETVALLRDLGVDFGQGFHLGRPRPVDDLLLEGHAEPSQ